MQTARISTTFGVALAMIFSGGCGGASRSVAPLFVPPQRMVMVGSPIKFNATDQVNNAQRINGHTYFCGSFGSRPGVIADGVTVIVPNSVVGIHLVTPYFVAGRKLYGYGQAVTMHQQPEGYMYDMDTYGEGSTGFGMPSGVSPDGSKVGMTLQTSFWPPVAQVVTILDTKSNKPVKVAAPSKLMPTLLALADTGAGVVSFEKPAGSGQVVYRFQANGALDVMPLSGTATFPVPVPKAMAPDGTVVGSVSGASSSHAAMWPAGSTTPILLGLPSLSDSSAATSITPDHVALGTMKTHSILWSDAVAEPNEVVDLNQVLPKPRGSTIKSIYSLQSNPVSFIAQLAMPKNGTAFQVYRAK